MSNKFENELWCPINGYEGLYSISNFGRVLSHHWGKSRILKQRVSPRGYSQVNLTKNSKLTTFRVHGLVAKHFLRNPNGLTEINHKDENKSNNRADNLEWCTRSHNVNYGTRISRQRLGVIKGVVQYDRKGDFVASYDSLTRASREVGLTVSHIAGCCKKKYPFAGGFVWKYATEVSNETSQ